MNGASYCFLLFPDFLTNHYELYSDNHIWVKTWESTAHSGCNVFSWNTVWYVVFCSWKGHSSKSQFLPQKDIFPSLLWSRPVTHHTHGSSHKNNQLLTQSPLLQVPYRLFFSVQLPYYPPLLTIPLPPLTLGNLIDPLSPQVLHVSPSSTLSRFSSIVNSARVSAIFSNFGSYSFFRSFGGYSIILIQSDPATTASNVLMFVSQSYACWPLLMAAARSAFHIFHCRTKIRYPFFVHSIRITPMKHFR